MALWLGRASHAVDPGSIPRRMRAGESAILLSTQQQMGTRQLPAGEGTRWRREELATLLHYAVGAGQCASLTGASPKPLDGYGPHLYLTFYV